MSNYVSVPDPCVETGARAVFKAVGVDGKFFPIFSEAQMMEAVAKANRLIDANTKLVGALDMIRETLSGGNVQDLIYIINTALEENDRALADLPISGN